MKTKYFLTMAALAGAVMMTSCSKDAPEPVVDDGAVKFTSNISSLIAESSSNTRVTDDKWDVDDKIGIFMLDNNHNADDIIATDVLANNIAYKYNMGNHLFEPANESTKISYPSDNDKKVDFIAYYPYQDGVNMKEDRANGLSQIPAGEIDIMLDTNQENSQKEYDLLWTNTNPNNENHGYDKNYSDAVRLPFKHQLSLFVMNVKLGKEFSNINAEDIAVKIYGVNIYGRFNLKTGELTKAPSSSSLSVTPRLLDTKPDGFTASYSAILIPTKKIYSVTFEFNGQKYTWNGSEIGNILFEKGKKHIFDITITHYNVKVKGTIEEWDVDPNGPIDIHI